MKQIVTMLLITIALLTNEQDIQAQTQTKPNLSAAVNNWFFLHPQLKVSSRIKIAAELHLRRDNWVMNNGSFLVRPYLTVKVNDMIALSAGYSYIRSWPTAPSFGLGPSDEHNIWEQLLLTHKLGKKKKVKLQHRYRLEHRFRDRWDFNGSSYTKNGIDFSNRFRYRITLKIPIVELPNGQKLYTQFFNEIWIDQYDYLLFKAIARNWIYLGVGWNFNKNGAIELGYMHQWDIKSTSNIHTHILQLSVAYTFEIKKKKKDS